MKSRHLTLILLVAMALGLIGLPGCAQHYVLKLSNGVQIVAASKPKLKGGSYYFKDASGREQSIPQGRVQEIAPASRAKEETSPFIKSGG